MSNEKQTLQEFIVENCDERVTGDSEFFLGIKNKEDRQLDCTLLAANGEKFQLMIYGNDITPFNDPMYQMRKMMIEANKEMDMEKIADDVNQFFETRSLTMPNFIKKAYDVLLQKGEEGFMEWLDNEAAYEIFPK